MLKLEEIQKDDWLQGIIKVEAVQVIAAQMVGDSVRLAYRLQSGNVREEMLYRDKEQHISRRAEAPKRTWDAPGRDFRLVLEALRMKTAHVYDPMMAVHTSNVEPLPHQITAVYEAMLPRQPLRFLLADDPGAGKTIMAGLLIRELLMRGDARRILVVVPGGLVTQWKTEMWEKFGLNFEIFKGLAEVTLGTNPWAFQDLWIARRDQISYNEEIINTLDQTWWDLIIVDEAHKFSASRYGKETKETKRYKLIKDHLGQRTRHLLLMTATPHNGKIDDFHLFLALLDPDRFERLGKSDVNIPTDDIMRRMIKEDLVKFDGTPLFPKRISKTVAYTLSPAEQALYDAVTDYIRTEMNRAVNLDKKRKGNVGFALTMMQRRLASSPEAIYRSLERRKKRLEEVLADLQTGKKQQDQLAERARQLGISEQDLAEVWDDEDELTGEESESLANEVSERMTAAETITELDAEIASLKPLVEQARALFHDQSDRKWEELSRLLQETPEMRDEQGRIRKLLIFTEHRETLTYLVRRITTLLGNPDAVVSIHGGTQRDDRGLIQEKFRHSPGVRVLVATDAAGEGINLQTANLLINYDLPWNPNRLEQRFGRNALSMACWIGDKQYAMRREKLSPRYTTCWDEIPVAMAVDHAGDLR